MAKRSELLICTPSGIHILRVVNIPTRPAIDGRLSMAPTTAARDRIRSTRRHADHLQAQIEYDRRRSIARIAHGAARAHRVNVGCLNADFALRCNLDFESEKTIRPFCRHDGRAPPKIAPKAVESRQRGQREHRLQTVWPPYPG